MSDHPGSLLQLLPSDLSARTAVIVPDGGPRVSYALLGEQVATLAQALRRGGIRPCDPVTIVLANGLEFLTTFLAVTRVRAIAAPLNPAYKVEEFRFYMEDTAARAVIVSPGDHPARAAAAMLDLPLWEARLDDQGRPCLYPLAVSPPPAADAGPPQAEDVALFLHTSGTTSGPKGVPLTHGNLMTSIGNIACHYQLTPDDVSLVVMPLFHVHGLLGATLSTLHSGGMVVLPPRFSAGSFWQHVLDHSVTWYSAVPTIHQVLVSRAEADQSPQGVLRFIRSCSAALAPAVFTRLEERFGAPVLEAYGMTEAAHQMTSNPQPPGARKAGTVGRGTGVEVMILNEEGQRLPVGQLGEVSIRGANVMAGYHNNPEANARAFSNRFFRTGDQGLLDAEGYLTLTGRLKELINRGGEKVSPLEVDAALLEHPAVAEAVCFGVPDPKYGEEIHAAVVLKIDVTVADLQGFCRERLADFKVPKEIHITQQVPRTATGKVQRRHVAAHFHDKGRGKS
jgi:acyl-CoA synthetase (AMP-forming)/AMP-acid ligase II